MYNFETDYVFFYDFSGNTADGNEILDIVFWNVGDIPGRDKLGAHASMDMQYIQYGNNLVSIEYFLHDVMFPANGEEPYWNPQNDIWFWCCAAGHPQSPLAQLLADITGAQVLAPVDILSVSPPDYYFVSSLGSEDIESLFNDDPNNYIFTDEYQQEQWKDFVPTDYVNLNILEKISNLVQYIIRTRGIAFTRVENTEHDIVLQYWAWYNNGDYIRGITSYNDAKARRELWNSFLYWNS